MKILCSVVVQNNVDYSEKLDRFYVDYEKLNGLSKEQTAELLLKQYIEKGKKEETISSKYNRADFTLRMWLCESVDDIVNNSKDKKDEEYQVDVAVNENAFDRVILPVGYRNRIIETISQVKNEAKIFQEWGFDKVFKRGRGVNILFSGASGTGKTLCAEVIAEYIGTEAKLFSVADIDNKYIGESEKTVQNIFASTGKNKVIIIDEADSFLYSRGGLGENGIHSMKTTNQFLMEMERHNGIAIFTTNRPGKLDPAVARRIDLVLDFPFPNKDARAQIWSRSLPAKLPQDIIDFETLASHELNGGQIKSIILSAVRKMVMDNEPKMNTELLLHALNQYTSINKNDYAR